MIKINPLTEGMSSALEICSFKRDYYRLLYFFSGPLISPLLLGRQDLSRRMRTEQQMCSLTAAFCSGHLQPRVPIPVGDRQERGDRGHSGAGKQGDPSLCFRNVFQRFTPMSQSLCSLYPGQLHLVHAGTNLWCPYLASLLLLPGAVILCLFRGNFAGP